MIACDVCNEWYHGRCVRVTALEARKIKLYVCPSCQQKTGNQIVYKTPKKRRSNAAKEEEKYKRKSNIDTRVNGIKRKLEELPSNDLDQKFKKKKTEMASNIETSREEKKIETKIEQEVKEEFKQENGGLLIFIISF